MRAYLDIVKNVLENGHEKYPVRYNHSSGEWEPVDGGVKTIALPNVLFTHDMSEGFPLLTTKKMAWKSIRVELEGFIKGITDKRWFQERNCTIWLSWANPTQMPEDVVDKKEWQRQNPDLGPIYGYQWRNFDRTYKPIEFRYTSSQVPSINIGRELESRLNTEWLSMIYRCYREGYENYSQYGERGIWVCNRWLVFEYFVEDVQKLDGWEKKLNNWSEYSLECVDYYSPDTAKWTDVQHSVSNFRRGTDQLKNIVDTLKTNPSDRRMVCSAWNPNQMPYMALPPCHYVWNVTVIGGKVHLFWAQRSCDLMLGVPFNIASYALLLELLAKEANLPAGNLSGMLVDCHIYENQLEGAKEQITREPYPLPKIEILDRNDKFDIFDWEYNDVVLHDYRHHDRIKFGEVIV